MEDFRSQVNQEANCKISECILMPQRIWNAQKLRSIFNEEVVVQILRIPIGPEDFEDRWIWHFEPRGNFTIKSCYRLLSSRRNQSGESSSGMSPDFWKWLWGLSLPRNLIFFMWRVCRSAIATRKNLHQRHCNVTEECVCCNSYLESAEHLFFQCCSFAGLWSRIIPGFQLPGVESSYMNWLLGMKNSGQTPLIVNICFVMWVIWKHRKKKLFENAELNMVEMEIQTIILSDCQTLTNAVKDQHDRWPWEAAAIIASITQIMRNHREISITYVGRMEVHEADLLAKRARDENLSNFWLIY
ncbi:Putative ribonuclease H protein At1g65750 [Linum perenne]